METSLDEKHKPKASKGWLTKTALVLFAVVALTDLSGCAALKNSADTIGNAAGSQITKGGLWVLGKDADCQFGATNASNYSPGGASTSGTSTINGCRELPSTEFQVKAAKQQEAIYDVHFAEQQRRMQEVLATQATLRRQNEEAFKKDQALRRAEAQTQQAVDTCHRRELDLLSQGKKMTPTEGCVEILQQDKQKTEALLAQNTKPPAPAKSTGFFSGFHLRD